MRWKSAQAVLNSIESLGYLMDFPKNYRYGHLQMKTKTNVLFMALFYFSIYVALFLSLSLLFLNY